MNRLSNNGYTILEVLIASAVAVTAGVWISQSMVNMTKAGRKLATASDTKSEAKALLDLFQKEFKARYVPAAGEPAEIEWSPLARTEPAFGNCGATNQACQKVMFRQRSSVNNIARTVLFESECGALPGSQFVFAVAPPLAGQLSLPGNYVSCGVGESPFVRITVGFQHLTGGAIPPALLSQASVTTYPHRPQLGAFLCARPCGNSLSAELGMIYGSESNRVEVYTNKLSLPFDRNTNIQILPP